MKRITKDDPAATKILQAASGTERRLLDEAFADDECELLLHEKSQKLYILFPHDFAESPNEYKLIGLLAGIYGEHNVVVFGAQETPYGITDRTTIINTRDMTISLDKLKETALREMNICPYCSEAVPYEKQTRISFSNRCCENCAPKLRAMFEKPGWYN